MEIAGNAGEFRETLRHVRQAGDLNVDHLALPLDAAVSHQGYRAARGPAELSSVSQS